MMRVSQNDALAKSLIDKSLGVSMAAPFVGLIVGDDKTTAAALIFNNFDRINIDLSITVFAPIPVACIRDVARYAFERLSVKRVTCLTSVTNHRAINRLLLLKFRLEGVLKERFPSGDALQFSLLASEQKFVRLSLGKHPERP